MSDSKRDASSEVVEKILKSKKIDVVEAGQIAAESC
jgi:hypothetical protein